MLGGYASPSPTRCFRTGKKLTFSPSVPKGTRVQAIEKGNSSNRLTFDVTSSNTSQINLTNAEKEFFRAFHEDVGGTIRLRFAFPGGSWSSTTQCSGNTPIGLDIDGSGAVERIQGNFMFDISGDGDIEHLHEWFAPTEGILLDAALAMKDGLVTSSHFLSNKSVVGADKRELTKHSGAVTGKHLFGDMGSLFADGFVKLAIKDSDKNGYVNGSELGGLAIWVDANSNAKVDAGELHSLLSYGIVGLRTTPNKGTFVSEAQLADGSTMMVEDLFFA